ncbi:MAG: glycoside hydrolase family 92 protein, partial [Gloeobacteraceae cyanobacterium ES-bin-144]|nr:glycoside hydrolase family 92 protein [Verrucomicrobiales bacterium]
HLELKHTHGKLVIQAPGTSSKNSYIKSIKLNGKPLERFNLQHAELFAQDALLEFEMTDVPQSGTSAKPVESKK